MPIYCSYGQWLLEHNKKFYDILVKFCLRPDEIRCNTLISPNDAIVSKMAKANTKESRREAMKLCNALQIQIDLHDKNFSPGTYKNNAGQGLQISAPSNGTFEIKSGKGFATTAKVKIANSFEPDMQYRSDEDRHMCVVELISGEIAVDGELFLGTQTTRPVKGSSEFTSTSKNIRLEAWHAIVCATKFELRNKLALDEAQSRLCGLLKFILKKIDSVPEYAEDAKVIRMALCYEPLASLYILLQPFGQSPILNKRFDDDLSYAPFICEDPHGLYNEFCEKFPCTIDHDERNKLVSEMIASDGITKIDEIQSIYFEQCKKLFSGVNFPCEQKLWADEVCYYICMQMKAIRASGDCDAFCKLCETLEQVYPGKSHQSESKLGSEEYWSELTTANEIADVTKFTKSFCCLQCCPSEGELAESCKGCLRPTRASNFLKMIIELNA